MASFVICALLYGAVFLLSYFGVFQEVKPTKLKHANRAAYLGGLGLLGLFFLQLMITQSMPGHVQDAGLFRAWTAFARDHALWEYYTTDLYVDYPPVYLYVLYGLGTVGKILHLSPESPGYLALIRSIPILFDGLGAALIYKLAQKEIGAKKALTLAFLSAVNPANILNSTVWGQVDAVTSLLSLIMLLCLYQKKYVASCTLFAFLFLTKPQMILFAPVLGFVFLFDIIESWPEKQERMALLKKVCCSILTMAAVLLLVPLPITGGNYMLLIENYKNALDLYPYATLNGANLYGLFGANWIEVTDKFLIFSYQTWGYLFIVLVSLLVGYGAFKQKNRVKIFYLAAFIVLGVFLFGHTMHERYTHPLLLILLALVIFTNDDKYLWFYGGFSLTEFLCCGLVLVLNQQDEFVYGDNVLFRVLSLCNILLFVLWVWYSAKKRMPASNPGSRKIPQPTDDKEIQGTSTKMVRVDYLLMFALTLFYALFGFFHLGSTAVPETGWYAETAGESVVLDLGKLQPVKQLYGFAGWIDRRKSDQEVDRDLTIATSADGVNWTTAETSMDLDAVFRWHVFRELPEEDFRYLRITCDDGRFYLNEIALFGKTEQERFFVASVLSDNETARQLTDEQDKVTYDFSWYDGTYFDEIYHPRTAYEFLNHRYPYENTHPPLGKVIISCGILLFGMNPFGWRFFGTLCGVLMVPLVYVTGKKMLKKTPYAFLAAFLFSFDFMHLSQTRLATIDSYTAFFVMGMYLFMYLYLEKNFFEIGLKKTLLPLFLSGLCFGLGAATKWQGIYAGFGLAVLYFYQLFRRYMEFRQAKKTLRDPISASIVARFPSMAMQTVCCGFLFFVLLPGVIYFLSYIPSMLTEETGLSFFFTNQGSMLRYHSGLTADHHYSSTCWEWLLNFKPLYAYGPNRDFIPQGISMGITSFGNPLIWWLSVPVVLWGVCDLIRHRRKPDLAVLTAVVGFFSLFAPWIFVQRATFIYHFFPCVVFVVLLLSRAMQRLGEENKKTRKYIWLYAGLVFILFVAFYPVLTGMQIPDWYAQALTWVDGWVLG